MASEKLALLASKLVKEFQEDQRGREPWEQLWLERYRLYVGEYEADIKARFDKDSCKLFMNICRVKVDTIVSRLMEILFPQAGDRNWSIEPTPEPVLEPAMMALVEEIRHANGDAAANAFLQDAAKQRAEAMSKVIADQLAESPDHVGYRATIREMVVDGAVYGMGIHKGPLVDERTRRIWKAKLITETDGSGQTVEREAWVLDKSPVERRPYYRRVSPWNFWWDQSADRRVGDCRRVWEAYRMVYGEVLELAERSGFLSDVIKDYLKEKRDGDATEYSFESEMRSINGNTPEPQIKGRWRVLERYGWLRGDELQECGVDLGKDSLTADYFCNIWMLGGKIIKAVRAPIRGVEYPYQIFPMFRDDSSLCGHGVTGIYRDAQRGTNAVARAMMDNARMSLGPIVGINKFALDQTQGPGDVRGGMKLMFENAEDMSKAIAFWQAASHTNDYLALAKYFGDMGDELTVPRWVHGDGNVSDAAKTLGGLSMLMNAMSVNLAEMVKIFDDEVTSPFVTSLYHWNMDFNPRPDIRGDFSVVARGATALVARDVQSQRLIQFMTMCASNPQFAPMVDVNKGLRQVATSMQIPADIVYDQATVEQNQQKQMAMQVQIEQATKLETLLNSMISRGITPDEALQQMLAETLQSMAAQQQQAQQAPAQGQPAALEAPASGGLHLPVAAPAAGLGLQEGA